MSKAEIGRSGRIDQFITGPGARGDQWRNLVELAESWSTGSGSRADFEAELAQMTATEEFHAYPGFQLMMALREHVAEDDAAATAFLTRRITRAILTRSFRQKPGDWEAHEDGEGVAADVLPPALGRADAHRPYFEIFDCHRSPCRALACSCCRMAPASPAAGCVRLRTGFRRQFRGRFLRDVAEPRSCGRGDP